MNSKKLIAFTLIELLVVIAIVGILSGFVLVSLNSATDAANDARRKSDLSQIVKALLVYNTSNPTYPIETCSIGSTCSATVNNALGQASGITGPNNTYYTYSSIDGTSFTVSAIMSDTDIYSYDSETGYSESPAEPGLPGYAKRQPITINSASALTDYQVKLTITYDSDMQSDFDDLRFTSADGTTELSYWLESKIDSTTAIVWVKVPSLASGDNTLYMYYANASATTASNGDNTFVFFDDFLGSSIDTNKWSKSGTITVADSIAIWSAGSQLASIPTFGLDYVIVYRAKIAMSIHDTLIDFKPVGDSAIRFQPHWPNNNVVNARIGKDGVYDDYNIGSYSFDYHTYKIYRYFGHNIFYVDGVFKLDYTGTKINIDNNGIRIYTGNNNACWLDWTYIRKYVESEPSFLFGVEQNN